MSEAFIVPLGDRLKVLPLRPPAKTKGGILLPEASEARERPLEGIVLMLGRGRTLESGALVPLECNIGDVVAFGKYAGIYVFDEALGHDVILMREDEALGFKPYAQLARVAHGGHALHVLGDPRCPICREGGEAAA